MSNNKILIISKCIFILSCFTWLFVFFVKTDSKQLRTDGYINLQTGSEVGLKKVYLEIKVDYSQKVAINNDSELKVELTNISFMDGTLCSEIKYLDSFLFKVELSGANFKIIPAKSDSISIHTGATMTFVISPQKVGIRKLFLKYSVINQIGHSTQVKNASDVITLYVMDEKILGLFSDKTANRLAQLANIIGLPSLLVFIVTWFIDRRKKRDIVK